MTHASAMMISAFLIAGELNAESPPATGAVFLVGGARLKSGIFILD